MTYAPRIKTRELLAAWIIIVAVMLAQLLATRQLRLFRHGLWLDETITWLICNDPSFTHAMAAIRGGVDTNPPTLYLLLRPLARLTGGLNEVGLHVVSFISISLAILGLYAICRRFFARLPSAIGAMVVAAHPTVIAQAFEARFYGPWLAATVWFAYAQMMQPARAESGGESRDGEWRDGESRVRAGGVGGMIARCALAVVAATIHWFGAIAVGMIVAVDLIVHRKPARRLLDRALPGICALAALAVFAPFYFGQRADLTVPTWLGPLDFGDMKKELTALLGSMSLVLVLIGAFLATLLGWTTRRPSEAATAAAEINGVRPLLFPSAPPPPAPTLIEGARAKPAPGTATAPTVAEINRVRPLLFPPSLRTGADSMRELLPLASLLLFPAVILVFSVLVQPAMKDRYMLVAAAPLAPLAAWLVSRLARVPLLLILAGVLAAGAAELVAQARSFNGKDEDWRRVLAAIDAAPDPSRPIIFKRRHELYPLLRLRPELLPRSATLDFDGQPSPEVAPLAQYERDMARKVRRFYPQFRAARLADMDGQPLYVISPAEEESELAALLGPGFTIEPRAEWLYEATSKLAASSSSSSSK